MIVFVGLNWALHELVFLGSWAFFGLAHRKGWWASSRYDEGKEPPEALYRKSVIEVGLSHVGYPLAMLPVWWAWDAMGGASATLEWWHWPVHLLAFVLIQDTLFYWSHRMLHHKRLFRLIHRKHHEFRHVRGVSAEYAHPVETTFNIIARWAGPILLASPLPIILAWTVVRVFETVLAHSGYAFEGISSRHAFHHRHPTKGCYGSFWGPWDPLMGTDAAWKESAEG